MIVLRNSMTVCDHPQDLAMVNLVVDHQLEVLIKDVASTILVSHIKLINHRFSETFLRGLKQSQDLQIAKV